MKRNKPEMVQGKTREEILALKADPSLNDEMAKAYDQENAKTLASNGIAPTPNFLNVMYRAGPGDGLKLLQAAQQNPGTLVKDIAPALATPGNNGAGTLMSGFLEESNVDPVKELVELIKTQRSFELNSQSIQVADQALQTIGNLRHG